MKIIYTCPECGGDLQHVLLTSDPPKHQEMCISCGWSSEVEDEVVVRIPYGGNKTSQKKTYLGDGWVISTADGVVKTNPCSNCMNHPSNGGSGICNCTLGGATVYC